MPFQNHGDSRLRTTPHGEETTYQIPALELGPKPTKRRAPKQTLKTPNLISPHSQQKIKIKVKVEIARQKKTSQEEPQIQREA